MSQIDEMVDIAELQKEIETYISLDSANVIFNYTETKTGQKVDVITVNPRHRQSFLFTSCEGRDKVDALKQALNYVKTYKEKENNYTIQWSLRGENELQTSYFSSKNIPEAIDKLLYGREPNSIEIFSVVLNPIS